MPESSRTPSLVDGEPVPTSTLVAERGFPAAPPVAEIAPLVLPIPGFADAPPAPVDDSAARAGAVPVDPEAATLPADAPTPAGAADSIACVSTAEAQAPARDRSARQALPRLIGWEVLLDQEGRVVVGEPGDRALDGRYLVVPQEDGSLDLHLVESLQVAAAPVEAAPPVVPAEAVDEDAAERELARWGRRALGDLGQDAGAAAAGRATGPLPLVDPTQADRPQPAASRSESPEANRSHLSAVATDFYYWLVQNRDAHQLFARHRREGAPDAAGSPEASPA